MSFDFENLQAQIPELQQLDCTLEVQSYEPSIDSSNMQPKIWLQLANTIEQAYLKYDGFVILHGSDTMAFTASALSFMLENLNKPVILTGSQLLWCAPYRCQRKFNYRNRSCLFLQRWGS